MKASLRLEAAQRPQWPRLYLLSRPRSCGRMPSLVGDGGQVLQVLGWALTRILTKIENEWERVSLQTKLENRTSTAFSACHC